MLTLMWMHCNPNRPIALLKMYTTRSAQDVARDAVQVFGGRGITKTGMGKLIEHVCVFGFYLYCMHALTIHRLSCSTIEPYRLTPFWAEVSDPCPSAVDRSGD